MCSKEDKTASKDKYLSLLLSAVPPGCEIIKFSDLKPSGKYENKAIFGKIQCSYPIHLLKRGHVRKLIITDASNEEDRQRKRLTVFLFNEFAKDSEFAEPEGYMLIVNFVTENLTRCSHGSELMPIQILVSGDESKVSFARKKPSSSDSAKSSPEKEQNLAEMSCQITRKKPPSSDTAKSSPEGKGKVTKSSSRLSKKRKTKNRTASSRSASQNGDEVEILSINRSSQGAASENDDEIEILPVKSPDKSNAAGEEVPEPRVAVPYEYQQLNELQETNSKNKCNIYGIVEKCSLKVIQGNNNRILEIVLYDQTASEFTISVYGGKEKVFPDVHPGDVVRIHRMQVFKLRGKLKGKCLDPKFMLIFCKDDSEITPKSVAKTFTFTPEDKIKVKEMFDFAEKKSEPKLICEIAIGDIVNVICQVIGTYISKKSDCVVLKIWDGTKSNVLEGEHLGLSGEEIDDELYITARRYFVNLFVYGNYALAAGELKPKDFIEVRNAHLYLSKEEPYTEKFCIPGGNKDQGVRLLNLEDERVVKLRERLDKILEDAQEFGGSQSTLGGNESFFLNCDISAFNPTPYSKEAAKTIPIIHNNELNPPETSKESSSSQSSEKKNNVLNQAETSKKSSNSQPSRKRNNKQDQAEVSKETRSSRSSQKNVKAPDKLKTTKEATNVPVFRSVLDNFLSDDEPEDSRNSALTKENSIVNVLNVGIKYGQSTQEFGAGLKEANRQPTNSNITSKVPESRGTSTREMINELSTSLNKPKKQMDPADFGVLYSSVPNSTQEDWWKSSQTISETIGHSHIKPSSIYDIISHKVPYKFRIFSAVLNYEPNDASIEILIRLYCPNCHYLSRSSKPTFKSFEIVDEVPFYHCLECSKTSGVESVLEYTFLAQFTFHDGSAFIDVYLWRQNAVNFFKGITPEQALREKSVADSVIKLLQSVCPNCGGNTDWFSYPTMDCCIMSYTAGGKTRYQLFDTKLK